MDDWTKNSSMGGRVYMPMRYEAVLLVALALAAFALEAFVLWLVL